MLSPKYKNIIFFILVKYAVFYILLMVRSNNFSILNISRLENADDWTYYLMYLLFLPAVSIVLFSAPIYFSLRLKTMPYFIILIGVIHYGILCLCVFYFSKTRRY